MNYSECLIKLVDFVAGVEQCDGFEPLVSVVVEPESVPCWQGDNVALLQLADLLVAIHEASAPAVVSLLPLGLERLGAPGDH